LLAAAELPSDKDVKPQEVLLVPEYSEGIVFDHDGNAYISHGKVITKITFKPEVKAVTWAETGAPDGHKILADGTHLVCDGSCHAVLHLDASGKVLEPASKECDGKPLRAPGDLTLDRRGGFYFTDPGESSARNPIGTIHYVDPEGKTHLVAGGLAFPSASCYGPTAKRSWSGRTSTTASSPTR
jgi:gluconolactonase